VNRIPFPKSLRAKFFAASLVLLLIPVIGVLFVRQLANFLRVGQEQVASTAAKLVAASLSDRPEINLRFAPLLSGLNDEAATERERIIALFQADDANTAASLGGTYQPDRNVERILSQSGLRDARIWVIDAAGRVRGLGGDIKTSIPKDQYRRGVSAGVSSNILAPITRVLMPLLLSGTNVRANLGDGKEAVFVQAQRAAAGQPNIEWRRDIRQRESHTVLAIAEPIWQKDSIVGAVVIEETDVEFRNLARDAAESVILMTLLVFVVAFGVLVWFAYRLTKRLTRLQRELDQVVDAKGRVLLTPGKVSAANDSDEIGALAQTLQAMAARQASYNQYLEQLAGRLSHELRTPVAVVRSSLDNLRGSTLAESDRVFLQRADEGVARLSSMISRMSEATQLERMLQGADRETFDLNALIDGCVSGYRLAFPTQEFVLAKHDTPITFNGIPDAIAQMLDKLVQNAVDFAAPNTPVVMRVAVGASSMKDLRDQRTGSVATLTVENKGALLPADTTAMFESMISHRPNTQQGGSGSHGGGGGQSGHLGLGLYVARLVAEFHQGHISAANLPANDGVEMVVTLPVGV
jgi:two-component system, OmpR family, sensor histidine kinase ChvG